MASYLVEDTCIHLIYLHTFLTHICRVWKAFENVHHTWKIILYIILTNIFLLYVSISKYRLTEEINYSTDICSLTEEHFILEITTFLIFSPSVVVNVRRKLKVDRFHIAKVSSRKWRCQEYETIIIPKFSRQFDQNSGELMSALARNVHIEEPTFQFVEYLPYRSDEMKNTYFLLKRTRDSRLTVDKSLFNTENQEESEMLLFLQWKESWGGPWKVLRRKDDLIPPHSLPQTARVKYVAYTEVLTLPNARYLHSPNAEMGDWHQ